MNYKEAAARFAELLKIKTVDGNHGEFVRFQETLTVMYPKIHEVCEREIVGDLGILYRWKGAGDEKSVVLMSHYDVVPAENGEWLYPPFSGSIAGGKIWGRGAIDTKCTLCAVMESVETLISRRFTPDFDVYLCFGGDEETAGESAAEIAAELGWRGVKPELILDEGGAVVDGSVAGIGGLCALVGIAEKGYMDVEFIARGKGGHSSIAGADNPIVTMAEVVRRMNSGLFRPYLCEPVRIMTTAAARHSKYGFLIKNHFLWGRLFRRTAVKLLPEITALTNTVCSITKISGGNAENVIPEEVCATGNFRVLNGTEVEEVMEIIRGALAGLDVEVNLLSGLEPSDISNTSGAGWDALSSAISETWGINAVIPYLMLARSDSRSYNGISDNIYRFSPMMMTKKERVSIHGINENISEESFYKMIDFYICLIENSIFV